MFQCIHIYGTLAWMHHGFQYCTYLIDKTKLVEKRRLFIGHRFTETHTIESAMNAIKYGERNVTPGGYLAKGQRERLPKPSCKTNTYFKQSD